MVRCKTWKLAYILIDHNQILSVQPEVGPELSYAKCNVEQPRRDLWASFNFAFTHWGEHACWPLWLGYGISLEKENQSSSENHNKLYNAQISTSLLLKTVLNYKSFGPHFSDSMITLTCLKSFKKRICKEKISQVQFRVMCNAILFREQSSVIKVLMFLVWPQYSTWTIRI